MVKKGIKLEIYRAFHNISYIVALVLGCIISIGHFIIYVLPKTQAIAGVNNLDYPWSIFNSCMPLDCFNYITDVFYYAVILIGTLPFGMSYYTDLREGYIKNVYTRMNSEWYMLGKYIAVFLSAGTVCVLPLILNILLTMTAIPALISQVGTMQFPILGSCMLSQLFYTHPFGYLVIYLIIDFALTGVFACMALAVSKYVYNRYLVLFAPFILFFLMQTVCAYTKLPNAAPLYAMKPTQTQWQQPYVIVGEISILFIVSFCIFYFGGGKKYDTL